MSRKNRCLDTWFLCFFASGELAHQSIRLDDDMWHSSLQGQRATGSSAALKCGQRNAECHKCRAHVELNNGNNVGKGLSLWWPADALRDLGIYNNENSKALNTWHTCKQSCLLTLRMRNLICSRLSSIRLIILW